MRMKAKIYLSIIGLLTIAPLMAQPAPPATPIDGGLSALLLAGGLYGAKKIYDKKRH